MLDIRLEKPIALEQTAVESLKQEFIAHGEEDIQGGALLGFLPFDLWIKYLKAAERWETVFFVIRESDCKIIGTMEIYHESDEYPLDEYAGHISYSVRPTERCKGYAVQILQAALAYCSEIGVKTARLGCFADNEASYRTMERCGGVRVAEKPYHDGRIVFIYQIPVSTKEEYHGI